MRINCPRANEEGEHPFATKTAHHKARGRLRGFSLLMGLLALGACHAGQPSVQGLRVVAGAHGDVTAVQSEESRMWMTVGDHRLAITLIENAAARAFTAQLPLTLDMADLNGNEKHAHLSKALPTNERRPGTIHSGDLMLYGSDTLVVFYMTFESSYAYTRLGLVNDPAALAQALGQTDVRIIFSNK